MKLQYLIVPIGLFFATITCALIYSCQQDSVAHIDGNVVGQTARINAFAESGSALIPKLFHGFLLQCATDNC